MGEQAVVQMIMTIYRFAAFAVMLVTVLVAFAYPRPEFRPNFVFHGICPQTVFFVTKLGVTAFDISGFAIVFTSGAVALNFHYNLPDIAKPVINKLVLTRIVSGISNNKNYVFIKSGSNYRVWILYTFSVFMRKLFWKCDRTAW